MKSTLSIINLCYITDDKYVELTQMAVFSAICSKSKNTQLNIYVICDNVSRDKIKDFMQLSCKDVSIKTISVNGDDFIKCSNQSRHVSKTTYLKIFLPDILKCLDKILYIDSDIFVRKDLTSLFNQLKDDNEYDMAAVKDLGILKIWPDETEACRTGNFFNAGLLLMNLNRLRGKDGLAARFQRLPESERHGKNQDQEPLNLLEFGKVKFIDIKYAISWNKIIMNIHPEVYKNIEIYNSVYKTSYKSIDELVEKSVAWHFHGDKKKMIENNEIKKIFDDIKKKLNDFKSNKKIGQNKIATGKQQHTVSKSSKSKKSIDKKQTNTIKKPKPKPIETQQKYLIFL